MTSATRMVLMHLPKNNPIDITFTDIDFTVNVGTLRKGKLYFIHSKNYNNEYNRIHCIMWMCEYLYMYTICTLFMLHKHCATLISIDLLNNIRCEYTWLFCHSVSGHHWPGPIDTLNISLYRSTVVTLTISFFQ